jgi:hypothetical protein
MIRIHDRAPLLAILLATACSDASTSPVEKATAMFVNVTTSPVDVYWGEAVVARQLPPYASSTCSSEPVFRAIVGKYASPFAPIAGMVAENQLATDSRSTIFFEGSSLARVAPANTVAPGAGEARRQFYTNSPEPLEVYLTTTDAPYVLPTASVGPLSYSPFVTVPLTATRMRVTRAGHPETILLDVDPLPLPDRRVGVTVIHPNSPSGLGYFTFEPCP